MAKKFPIQFNFQAFDKVSKVTKKIGQRFDRLKKKTRSLSNQFFIAQKKMEMMRKTLGRIGSGMRNFGRSMTMGATLPIAAAGATIFKTAFDFQKSINKVGAITQTIIGGKVTKSFERLEAEAKRLGSTTEFSATQAADAMALLGRAGFSTEEIIASTSDVLALASASGFDLAFTADVMAKSIRSFGLEADQAGRVSDVLAAASARANVDLETLSETFKDAAPIATAYGATFEQTTAITALLGDIGIQGSKAGTTLKNMFIQLAAPSDTAKELFKAMRISLKDSTGEMKSASQVLTELGPGLKNLNKGDQLAVLDELFGKRAIAGGAALMAKAMKEGKDPIEAFAKALTGTKGVAKDMQKTMQRGIVGAMARFQSAFEGMAIAIANSGFLDFMEKAVVKLTDFFTWIGEQDQSWLAWGTAIAGAVAVAGPLIWSLGMIFTAISALVPVVTGIVTLVGAFGVALFTVTAPIWVTVAAVVALGAAIFRVWQKWGELKKAFTGSKTFLGGLQKAAGIFFGFGGGDEKEKSLTAPPPRTNAAQIGKAIAQETRTTNDARVRVDFRNAPKGTRVKTESTTGGIPPELNLGFGLGTF